MLACSSSADVHSDFVLENIRKALVSYRWMAWLKCHKSVQFQDPLSSTTASILDCDSSDLRSTRNWRTNIHLLLAID